MEPDSMARFIRLWINAVSSQSSIMYKQTAISTTPSLPFPPTIAAVSEF